MSWDCRYKQGFSVVVSAGGKWLARFSVLELVCGHWTESDPASPSCRDSRARLSDCLSSESVPGLLAATPSMDGWRRLVSYYNISVIKADPVGVILSARTSLSAPAGVRFRSSVSFITRTVCPTPNVLQCPSLRLDAFSCHSTTAERCKIFFKLMIISMATQSHNPTFCYSTS